MPFCAFVFDEAERSRAHRVVATGALGGEDRRDVFAEGRGFRSGGLKSRNNRAASKQSAEGCLNKFHRNGSGPHAKLRRSLARARFSASMDLAGVLDAEVVSVPQTRTPGNEPEPKRRSGPASEAEKKVALGEQHRPADDQPRKEAEHEREKGNGAKKSGGVGGEVGGGHLGSS
jgi:hypothetical protein